MATPQEHISMALFCDFENVALGVRDANYDKFDIKRVLERLLLKGSIVVKKAYCDWERYKGFKAAMHEANFELIEIPHVRQSGKNSADIRLVVDALDLCYTKSHVNTFVIISGDSDFSPLVSKLRENAKYVIGVGVKQSTSDLLIANCDEFIFYDDLVRESQRQAARQGNRDSRDHQQPRRSPEEERRRREEMDARRTKVIEMAAETYEALVTDRDEGGRIWASVLKEALKRRNPGFNESYYGFRTFGNLLEEAQQRGLLEFGRDEKSGAYVYRGSGIPRAEHSPVVTHEAVAAHAAEAPDHASAAVIAAEPTEAYAGEAHAPSAPANGHASGGRGRQRGGRRSGGKHAAHEHAAAASAPSPAAMPAPTPAPVEPVEPVEHRSTAAPADAPSATDQPAAKSKRGGRRPASATPAADAVAQTAPAEAAQPAPSAPETAAKKAPSRSRSPRKPAAKKAARGNAPTE
ncbi:MAG: NYN domain-containing protein [Aquabacterium sp.]